MPQVNIGICSERLAVIARAAAVRGVSRTEFVLRSSEAAAMEVFNEPPVITLDDEAWGGARTCVACAGDRVAGFYSFAASSVERRRAASRVGRNMPDPVPVILPGQLAVDEAWRGRRLGSDLMVDAARRSRVAAGMIGARAVIAQAIDERARAFYEKFGFRPVSDREPLMLVLRMSEINRLLEP